MTRLLGIVGSPRKGGNTEIIMREILKAGEQEGAEIELIRLVDFTLKPCNGCQTCFETKKCNIEDDAEEILEKMMEADGVIVGTPVYFFNVSAQTKMFIDRVGYLNIARKRKALRNKIGGAMAVAGRQGLTQASSEILLFLANARMIIVGPFVTVLASAKGDVAKDKYGIGEARELGKSMVRVAEATAELRKDAEAN